MAMGDGDIWLAFYRTTIILLTHVEHGVDDSFAKQILIIFLVLGSYFIVAYLIRVIGEYFMGGEFYENRRRRKMRKDISKLKDHFIVAGFGRVGKQVCEDLYHANVDFVVLDRDLREINEAKSLGYLALPGDPTLEGHLKGGGINEAKAIITCLGEDADNLFVTLTARSLNPNLYVVARVNDETNKEKMEKAGANRVAMPYQIGGYHMATMALRPAVLDFLDVIVDSRHQELEVEEMEIPRLSPLAGKTIAETLNREITGTTVLAINHHDGSSKVNPSGETVIHGGDKLIIMGNRKQLDNVTEIVTV
jgi:voltage-gated potassium channel